MSGGGCIEPFIGRSKDKTGMGHHQAKPKKSSRENSSLQLSPAKSTKVDPADHEKGAHGKASQHGQSTAGSEGRSDGSFSRRGGGHFHRNTKVTPVKVRGDVESGVHADASIFQIHSAQDEDEIIEVKMNQLGKSRYGNITPEPLPNQETEDGYITIIQLFNSMSDGQVRSYVSDSLFLLLLDVRSTSTYEKEHITSAYHHTALDQSGTLQPITEYTLVVAYDDDGRGLSLSSSRLMRVHDKLRQQGVDIFVLEGGFRAFKQAHPYLVTDRVPLTDREPKRQITTYPSIILDNQLYQGRCDQALEKKILENLKITHIVNITVNRPCPFTDIVQYLNILLEDEFKSDLLAAFPSVIKFIRRALAEGGRVLVHCKLGVSRSSTVVLAYLMHEYHWNLRDAYHYLKERRPVVRPNRGFLKQLSQFEEMIFGCKSVESDDLFF